MTHVPAAGNTHFDSTGTAFMVYADQYRSATEVWLTRPNPGAGFLLPRVIMLPRILFGRGCVLFLNDYKITPEEPSVLNARNQQQ